MLVNKIDELTANSKASVEVALKAITSSFGNLERLTALNINTARTLLRAGLVHAPEVFKGSGCAVGEVNLLQDDVVAVPDESMGLKSLPFPYLDGQRRRLRN